MAANQSFRRAISKASLPYDNPAPEWRILRKAIIQLASITLRHFPRRESISDTDKKLLTKLLDKLIWSYTEAPGKYRGNPIWSVGAVKSYGKWGAHSWRRSNQDIRLDIPDGDRVLPDRISPRTYIVRKLLKLVTPTERNVGRIFRKHAVAAVVTQKENRRLKHGDSLRFLNHTGSRPWHRYKVASIKLVH